MGFSPGGLFQARSQSLKELIEFVQDFGYYNVDQRIVGGPKWLGSSKFDIEVSAMKRQCACASFRKGTVKRTDSRGTGHGFQALLADRFRLRDTS